ncbi:LysR family transcriptional regulator [Enterobacter roggenkampii]|jgi:DNA-binding transcriptional LysR family regulator|uniref:LysR family transcriptional regulator n=1 Tax=Enterobacter cloacae complex TaxID=354276 RepID=UPI0005EE3338|nr:MULTISPECIES: LysR family transcriptional regulator [Enterobacter cloacae complex]EKS6941224.1 LysR family transcriptional regulator [Enterobacter roggenkampii]KJM87113.1 LysR family transcriptional regulator [Enterobacter roggenkampii]KJN52955.1 LysR family transcriptional regulator [Enterobacter roggenkampii]KZP78911.1 LysR family transcriptional regulator [Enterobacter roggenkampii]MCC3241241.1 LysR family transcriptional regulator [Enterobacter cloacae complex sp. 2021EL-01169]
MKLEDVEVFVEAIKTGSLAGAARRLSMSAMAASRSLNHLEAELGVRLVHRTTRSLSPTSDGEVFLPHAQALLEDKNNALADLFPEGSHLAGRLRITASAGFGRKIVAPMLTRFMQQHPALQVDLLATDEQVDIVGKGIDVALRIAPLRDNRLVAHRLCHNPRDLCASAAYLAANGYPKSFNDLAAHSCLTMSDTVHWSFEQGEQRYKQKVSGRFSANSVEAIFEACLGGMGIANLSRWYVEPAFREGKLERIVLEDAQPESLAVWAVYPTSRLIPAKVRKFVEALEAELLLNPLTQPT